MHRRETTFQNSKGGVSALCRGKRKKEKKRDAPEPIHGGLVAVQVPIGGRSKIAVVHAWNMFPIVHLI